MYCKMPNNTSDGGTEAICYRFEMNKAIQLVCTIQKYSDVFI